MIISRQVETGSVEATMEFGRELAGQLRAGDVLALYGELGAGKTALVKGIAAGLGIETDVTSPTFTLVHEYEGGRLRLVHADLYRLGSIDDVLDIGMEEYMESGGVTVIEWAEKIEPVLPGRAVRIRLETIDESTRRITITTS
jgi:tRNA threonylcarbamoyladenosine biosynthesis protein TsaE